MPTLARKRGGRTVVGNPNVKSQSFAIELFGAKVYVTVRYTLPRMVGGEEWTPTIVNIEASPLEACLIDVDRTARRVSVLFNRCLKRRGLLLKAWDVRQWFEKNAMPQTPRPVAPPQAAGGPCWHCGNALLRNYSDEDVTCLVCGRAQGRGLRQAQGVET